MKASIMARQTASATSGASPAARAWLRRSAITWATRSGAATACWFHQPLAAGQQPDKLAIQGVDVPAQFCQS